MRYRSFAYYWPIEILLSCIIAASRGRAGGEGMVIVGGVVVVVGWIWGVVCIIGCMSEKRSARGTVVSKTKEGCEERLYHS